MAGISVPGVGSGLDINGLVTQLVALERRPAQLQIDRLRVQTQAKISGLGSLSASLNGLKAAFEALSDGTAFLKRTATSGDTEVVKATAADGATAGKISVKVLALASAHKLSSAAFADAGALVGTGTLTLSVNGKNLALVIDSTNGSLTAIRDAINGATDNPGIGATIVNGTDGAHLVLSATESGAIGAIKVTASGGDGGLAALTFDPANPPNGLTEVVPAQDAQVSVDGIAATASGNRIDKVIEGLTLDLVAAAPGAPVDIEVAVDRGAISAAVNGFVASYNALVATQKQLSSFNADTGAAGVLLGDATLRSVQAQLSQALAVRVTDGGFASLSEIGVRVEVDGKLSVNATALDAAIDGKLDALAAFFSKDSPFGAAVGQVFERFLGDTGALDLRTQSLTDGQKALDAQQERLDARLASTEARLRAQFTALDGLLSRLQSTSSFLAQQLAGVAGTQ